MINKKSDKSIDSKFNIIAESANNFRVEMIRYLGYNDSLQILELSKELEHVFGIDAILTESNIKKYFNDKTFPFVARLNDNIIGFIIGVPLEVFSEESWSHYDINLGKENTIYTYMFLVKSFYRKTSGHSKILKLIYVNWCKKNNFKYITGHVKNGISSNFSKETIVVKIFPKWYNSNIPFEYYRRPL